eukprot:TRINITY_DN18894_c0_g1_i1.p1 TRINITY_DN18894_c0_g1~~TRINITY_DN18894_c0_g1_i1.p1  ORF type:complete len:197 (-),score=25.17 TRINITY_DN18894_c0_g1_i1:70-627(-)
MRHHFANKYRLSRAKAPRKALLRSLATNLIKHERIKTTVNRAKALKQVADRLVTYAKRGGIANRRIAEGYIYEKGATAKLFTVLKERFEHRPGGYTRVVLAGNRKGDHAPMAFIEFLPEGEKMFALPQDGASKRGNAVDRMDLLNDKFSKFSVDDAEVEVAGLESLVGGNEGKGKGKAKAPEDSA